jgi:hypothetical protein
MRISKDSSEFKKGAHVPLFSFSLMLAQSSNLLALAKSISDYIEGNHMASEGQQRDYQFTELSWGTDLTCQMKSRSGLEIFRLDSCK